MNTIARLGVGLLIVAACSSSCAGSDSSVDGGAAGSSSGGTINNGGTGAGAAASTGGAAGIGGATSNGGATGTGIPDGGTFGRGGIGAASSNGGATGTGGATGIGGKTGTGGTTGSSRNTGIGGATGTGGTTRTGGATGDGGPGGSPRILWSDSIQSNVSPWGLDGIGVAHPIDTSVTPSDANGANLSVVADPLGGGGLALRHFATFDTGGSRSQAGIYGDANTIFGNQAKRPEGIWVAQEWYFPEAIDAEGDSGCWINLWDWHSIDANRGNRWHTSPGLMLARDGSMRVVWEWGGPAKDINPASKYSSIALPVGRWFDIEMHYAWSDTPSATITLWIDGQLALEQSGVQTRAASHQVAETYLKFYGSTQAGGAWVPTPSLKYTRNVRIAAERIWR